MSTYNWDWIKKWRKDNWKSIQQVVGTKTPAIVRLLERKKKLEIQLDKIENTILKKCPHALEDLKYEEHGRSDEYGRYLDGLDTYVTCLACGESVWESHD